MTHRPLITNSDENGGVHPPAKLAAAYLPNIMSAFNITAEAGEAKIAEVRSFEALLPDILRKHLDKAQTTTRHGITAGIVHDDVGVHVAEAMADIIKAAAPFSFAPHLNGGPGVEHIRRALLTAFADTVKSEHSWHADRLAGRAPKSHMAMYGQLTNHAALHPAFVAQAKKVKP